MVIVHHSGHLPSTGESVVAMQVAGDDWTDPTDDEITKCLDDRWRDSDELLEDVFVNLHVTDQEIRDALESGEEVSSSTPPNHIYSTVGRFFCAEAIYILRTAPKCVLHEMCWV